MTHSIFAPSSAERAVACAASVTLEPRFPESEQDEEALEGTAAHWVVEQNLHGVIVNEGDATPVGVFVTDEMLDGAEIMVTAIAREIAPWGRVPTEGETEVKVSIPRTHELCWGTMDYRMWLPPIAGKPRWTLLVADYKFGRRHVEVFENWQLMDYVSGSISEAQSAALAAGGVPVLDSEIDVVCMVVQPRSYHRDGSVRTWRFLGDDIRAHVNIRATQARKALEPNPPAATGAHCGDCRARHACSLLQQSAYAAIDYVGRATPLELPPDAMGLELTILDAAIDRLKARKSGLEEAVKGTMQRGGNVPGWAVQFGLGREGWTVPDAKIISIGKMLGLDVAKAPKALTPKQAADLGFPVDSMRDLVDRPRTAAKLVKDDGTAARKVFG